MDIVLINRPIMYLLLWCFIGALSYSCLSIDDIIRNGEQYKCKEELILFLFSMCVGFVMPVFIIVYAIRFNCRKKSELTRLFNFARKKINLGFLKLLTKK